MKLSTCFLLILAAVTVAACSSNEGTTNPDPNPNPTQKPEPPVHKKQYDVAKGGVQIIAVYYDQMKNMEVYRLDHQDEIVVLESDDTVSLEGWILDANDPEQRFTLDRPIRHTLWIYTKQGPVGTSDTVLALNYKTNWIWNNSNHDIARLFNDKGELVDSLTY